VANLAAVHDKVKVSSLYDIKKIAGSTLHDEVIPGLDLQSLHRQYLR
jgi:hypothetical protein